jgi:hypothetical protein
MAVLAQETPVFSSVKGLSVQEVAVSVCSLFGWLALFSGGLIIGTEPYRKALGNPDLQLAFFDLLRHWSIVFTCYTLTNVALLCCFASLLGACGRRAKLEVYEEAEESAVGNQYVASLIRGFFIYLVLLSGVLILFDQPFSAPSQQQYLRLAGFVSLLSFLVGYNPHLFARLLARIAELVEVGPRSEQVNEARERSRLASR